MGLHLVGSRTNFLCVPSRKETKSSGTVCASADGRWLIEDVWMGLHLVGSRTIISSVYFLCVPTRKETKSLALGVHQLMEDG